MAQVTSPDPAFAALGPVPPRASALPVRAGPQVGEGVGPSDLGVSVIRGLELAIARIDTEDPFSAYRVAV
jgi:hypothetical protein